MQLKLPFVSVQWASGWQVCVPIAHSFTFVQPAPGARPSPENPMLQLQL